MADIDNKVVSLEFDNSKFEQNAQQSLSTLDKFKAKLKTGIIAGGIVGLASHFRKTNDEVQNLNNSLSKTGSSLNLSGIESQLVKLNKRFTVMGNAWQTMVSNTVTKLQNGISNVVKSATTGGVKSGFGEYENYIQSMQTIYLNTARYGSSLSDVKGALNDLNHYADETIYNFSQMTSNVAKFTSATGDLKKSVNSVQGMANLAALGGVSNEEAQRAMYQMSQAQSSGVIKAMDWMSMTNSGMANRQMEDEVVKIADNLGLKASEAIAKHGSFKDSLTEGWFTSDVWDKFMDEMTDDSTELGKMGKEAATKVKSFTQLFDQLGEEIGSNWTNIWMSIVGDYSEVKTVLTKFKNDIQPLIAGPFQKLGDAFTEWHDKMADGWDETGAQRNMYQELWYSVTLFTKALIEMNKQVNEAISDVFGTDLEGFLEKITKSVHDFAVELYKIFVWGQNGKGELTDTKTLIYNIVYAISSIVKAVKNVMHAISSPILEAIKDSLPDIFDVLNGIAYTIAEFTGKLANARGADSFFNALYASVRAAIKVIQLAYTLVSNIFSSVGKGSGKVKKLTSPINSIFDAITRIASTIYNVADYLIESGKIEGFANTIRNVVSSLWSFVQPIILKVGLLVSNLIGSIFNVTFDNDILTSLGTNGGPLSTVKTLITYISTGKKEASSVPSVASSVAKAIKSIFTAIGNGESVSDAALEGFKNIQSSIANSRLGKVVKGIMQTIINVFTVFAALVKTTTPYVKKFMSAIKEIKTEDVEKFVTLINPLQLLDRLFTHLASLATTVKNFFKSVANGTDILSTSGNPTLQKLAGWIRQIAANIKNMTLDDWINAIKELITIVYAFDFHKFLNSLTGVNDSISGLINPLDNLGSTGKKVAKALTRALNAYANSQSSNMIKSIALSIGMLTASMIALALVPTDKIEVSGTIIVGTLITLVNAVKNIKADSARGLAGMLLGFAAAMTTATAAIIILGNIKADKAMRGAIIIEGLIMVLSRSMKNIAKAMSGLSAGKDTNVNAIKAWGKNMKLITKTIFPIALSVIAVGVAANAIGAENITTAALAISGVLATIGLTMGVIILALTKDESGISVTNGAKDKTKLQMYTDTVSRLDAYTDLIKTIVRSVLGIAITLTAATALLTHGKNGMKSEEEINDTIKMLQAITLSVTILLGAIAAVAVAVGLYKKFTQKNIEEGTDTDDTERVSKWVRNIEGVLTSLGAAAVLIAGAAAIILSTGAEDKEITAAGTALMKLVIAVGSIAAILTVAGTILDKKLGSDGGEEFGEALKSPFFQNIAGYVALLSASALVISKSLATIIQTANGNAEVINSAGNAIFAITFAIGTIAAALIIVSKTIKFDEDAMATAKTMLLIAGTIGSLSIAVMAISVAMSNLVKVAAATNIDTNKLWALAGILGVSLTVIGLISVALIKIGEKLSQSVANTGIRQVVAELGLLVGVIYGMGKMLQSLSDAMTSMIAAVSSGNITDEQLLIIAGSLAGMLVVISAIGILMAKVSQKMAKRAAGNRSGLYFGDVKYLAAIAAVMYILAAALNTLITPLTKFASAGGSWQEILVILGGITALIAVAGLTISGTVKSLTKSLDALSKVVQGVKAITLIATIQAVAKLGVAIASVAASLALLSACNPIGIITALGAIGAGLAMLVGNFLTGLLAYSKDKMIDGIWELFEVIAQAIGAFCAKIVAAVMIALTYSVAEIARYLPAFLTALYDLVMELIIGIADMLPGIITALVYLCVEAINAVAIAITDNADVLMLAVQNLAAAVAQVLVEVFFELGMILQGLVAGLADSFGFHDWADEVKDAIEYETESMSEIGKNVYDAIFPESAKKMYDRRINDVKDDMKGLYQDNATEMNQDIAYYNGSDSAAPDLPDVPSKPTDGTIPGSTDKEVQNTKSTAENLKAIDKGTQDLSTGAETAKQMGDIIQLLPGKKLKGFGSKLSMVGTNTKSLSDKVNTLSDSAEKVNDVATTASATISTGAKDSGEAVVDSADKAEGGISGFFKSLFSKDGKAKSAGKDSGKSFVSGFSGALSTNGIDVSNVFGSSTDAAKDQGEKDGIAYLEGFNNGTNGNIGTGTDGESIFKFGGSSADTAGLGGEEADRIKKSGIVLGKKFSDGVVMGFDSTGHAVQLNKDGTMKISRNAVIDPGTLDSKTYTDLYTNWLNSAEEDLDSFTDNWVASFVKIAEQSGASAKDIADAWNVVRDIENGGTLDEKGYEKLKKVGIGGTDFENDLINASAANNGTPHTAMATTGSFESSLDEGWADTDSFNTAFDNFISKLDSASDSLETFNWSLGGSDMEAHQGDFENIFDGKGGWSNISTINTKDSSGKQLNLKRFKSGTEVDRSENEVTYVAVAGNGEIFYVHLTKTVDEDGNESFSLSQEDSGVNITSVIPNASSNKTGWSKWTNKELDDFLTNNNLHSTKAISKLNPNYTAPDTDHPEEALGGSEEKHDKGVEKNRSEYTDTSDWWTEHGNEWRAYWDDKADKAEEQGNGFLTALSKGTSMIVSAVTGGMSAIGTAYDDVRYGIDSAKTEDEIHSENGKLIKQLNSYAKEMQSAGIASSDYWKNESYTSTIAAGVNALTDQYNSGNLDKESYFTELQRLLPDDDIKNLDPGNLHDMNVIQQKATKWLDRYNQFVEQTQTGINMIDKSYDQASVSLSNAGKALDKFDEAYKDQDKGRLKTDNDFKNLSDITKSGHRTEGFYKLIDGTEVGSRFKNNKHLYDKTGPIAGLYADSVYRQALASGEIDEKQYDKYAKDIGVWKRSNEDWDTLLSGINVTMEEAEELVIEGISDYYQITREEAKAMFDEYSKEDFEKNWQNKDYNAAIESADNVKQETQEDYKEGDFDLDILKEPNEAQKNIDANVQEAVSGQKTIADAVKEIKDKYVYNKTDGQIDKENRWDGYTETKNGSINQLTYLEQNKDLDYGQQRQKEVDENTIRAFAYQHGLGDEDDLDKFFEIMGKKEDERTDQEQSYYDEFIAKLGTNGFNVDGGANSSGMTADELKAFIKQQEQAQQEEYRKGQDTYNKTPTSIDAIEWLAKKAADGGLDYGQQQQYEHDKELIQAYSGMSDADLDKFFTIAAKEDSARTDEENTFYNNALSLLKTNGLNLSGGNNFLPEGYADKYDAEISATNGTTDAVNDLKTKVEEGFDALTDADAEDEGKKLYDLFESGQKTWYPREYDYDGDGKYDEFNQYAYDLNTYTNMVNDFIRRGIAAQSKNEGKGNFSGWDSRDVQIWQDMWSEIKSFLTKVIGLTEDEVNALLQQDPNYIISKITGVADSWGNGQYAYRCDKRDEYLDSIDETVKEIKNPASLASTESAGLSVFDDLESALQKWVPKTDDYDGDGEKDELDLSQYSPEERWNLFEKYYNEAVAAGGNTDNMSLAGRQFMESAMSTVSSVMQQNLEAEGIVNDNYSFDQYKADNPMDYLARLYNIVLAGYTAGYDKMYEDYLETIAKNTKDIADKLDKLKNQYTYGIKGVAEGIDLTMASMKDMTGIDQAQLAQNAKSAFDNKINGYRVDALTELMNSGVKDGKTISDNIDTINQSSADLYDTASQAYNNVFGKANARSQSQYGDLLAPQVEYIQSLSDSDKENMQQYGAPVNALGSTGNYDQQTQLNDLEQWANDKLGTYYDSDKYKKLIDDDGSAYKSAMAAAKFAGGWSTTSAQVQTAQAVADGINNSSIGNAFGDNGDNVAKLNDWLQESMDKMYNQLVADGKVKPGTVQIDGMTAGRILGNKYTSTYTSSVRGV